MRRRKGRGHGAASAKAAASISSALAWPITAAIWRRAAACVEPHLGHDELRSGGGVGVVVDGERRTVADTARVAAQDAQAGGGNVETHMRSARGPTSSTTRRRISSAALFVKVMAGYSHGAASPVASRWARCDGEDPGLARAAPATTSSVPAVRRRLRCGRQALQERRRRARAKRRAQLLHPRGGGGAGRLVVSSRPGTAGAGRPAPARAVPAISSSEEQLWRSPIREAAQAHSRAAAGSGDIRCSTPATPTRWCPRRSTSRERHRFTPSPQ